MLSKGVHEHTNHEKLQTVINTSADDQIGSSIIFDDPYVEDNGEKDEHDSNAHDQSYDDIKSLIYNVQIEAENQHKTNNELKKQKALLQKELDTSLEREISVEKEKSEKLLNEKDKIQGELFQIRDETLKIKHETELYKNDFKERENKYPDDIVSLEEKLRSHDRIVYNMSHSIQTIHMLQKKPNMVYDPHLKTGLGYQNPERLKKAIAAQPKMYDGEKLESTKLKVDLPD
ncbi:hypothetical protein Tco_1064326 [Tanacetum coccineum]